ncbi:MAG: LuxR C-terminal-related transcriptional regulator [Desulfobacterales bacterium]
MNPFAPSLPVTFSDPLARTVLDSLSAHIAILDEKGFIVESNRAWRSYACKNGMKGKPDSIGLNYLDICNAATGEESEDARHVAAGIRAVLAGRIGEFLYDYPCHSPEGRYWYYMRAVGMQHEGKIMAVVSHENITALKLAEENLKEREQELREHNVALKVLLKQRENDRADLEQKMLRNVKELVLPYVEKLKKSNLRPDQKTFAEIVETHLNDIISPFLHRLSAAEIFLTPQEMQVAALVRQGRSSKDIAEILNIAETTVHFHRRNLRIKFGLKKRQGNLRTHLMSLSQN